MQIMQWILGPKISSHHFIPRSNFLGCQASSGESKPAAFKVACLIFSLSLSLHTSCQVSEVGTPNERNDLTVLFISSCTKSAPWPELCLPLTEKTQNSSSRLEALQDIIFPAPNLLKVAADTWDLGCLVP